MYEYYNPNPDGLNVGDCTIRAICKATDEDWDTVYAGVTVCGYQLKDMPSANYVWGAYVRKHGFTKHLVDDKGKDHYTVKDFCRDNPKGTYLLVVPGHVVCVKDGTYYDSWDSGNERPQYLWRKN